MRTSSQSAEARSKPLRLGPAVRAAICEHAETAYPDEACGGLLGWERDAWVEVAEAVPLRNDRQDERRRRYLIGPREVLELERRAQRSDAQVVGYYHSHPDARAQPSDFDLAHAWPWYIYLITSVSDGAAREMSAWRLAEDRRHFRGVSIEEDE